MTNFNQRSQLDELMDAPCSRAEMRACLRDLAWTNKWTLAYRPQIHWLGTLADKLSALSDPIRILDVGSGYGDGLNRIEQWAETRGIAVELTGLDLNPDVRVIAAEAAPASSKIRWVTGDVFAYAPPQQAHLIVSSLFTHHLSEDNIVRFLRWMEKNAKMGWYINDLSRAAIPYYSFKVFAMLARLHPYVQHDGPISIARAFKKQDWQRMCAASGLEEQEVNIESFTPSRLCVSRRKPSLWRLNR
jgi:SAM-dependent methyltransferase